MEVRLISTCASRAPSAEMQRPTQKMYGVLAGRRTVQETFASMGEPNEAAPVNAPIASRFQFEHSWRRVTEQRR